MERFVIKGGVALNGEVEIGGAKNAALGLLAAAIMTDEDVTIENLPDVSDIICLVLFWASLTRQRLLFRVDAQSVADLLTCILRDLELWEQMLLLIMVWLMLRRNV